jgi:hypothetical protein
LSDKYSSNALDKKDGKKFDEMFDIPRNYISDCSYSVQCKAAPNTDVDTALSLQAAKRMYFRS